MTPKKARQLLEAAHKRPLGATGDLLKPWLHSMTDSQVATLGKVLRKAHTNKWSNAELLKTLKGTKAKNFADGLLSRFGKQNATVIKTAMQHINNSSRQVAWAENDDVMLGYQWVSVLDDKTSPTCEELDGQVFQFGDGPIPPAHPNCRSTTVGVTDPKVKVPNNVAITTTFAEWLEDND